MTRGTAAAFVAGFVLLTATAFNVFYKVGDSSIVTFDEARHGISALEMIASGNYIVNTYEGESDYWNLKPVLAFWPMVAGFKIFGSNAFGLRFFSCFFTLLTVSTLALTGKRHGNIRVGLLAALLLITTRMFIAHHNARSGDADATFIFFFTASFCLILGRSPSLIRYCAASFFAALAFLTKSFHAGPLCVAIAVFFFMDNRLTFRSLSRGCLVFASFLLPVFLWTAARYQYDGMTFFDHMLGVDAVERLSVAVEGHKANMFFTVSFILSDFRIWLQVVFISAVITFFSRRPGGDVSVIDRRVLVKLLIIILFPVLLYTASPTKLRWYAFCVYPPLALLLAFFLDYCFRRQKRGMVFGILLYALVTVGFVLSEVKTVEAIHARTKRFNDPLQNRILSLSREKASSVSVFLEKGDWAQSHILVAMFAPNVFLRTGNTEAYNMWAGEKHLFAKPDIKE